MAKSNVVRLDEYRSRRTSRLHLVRALNRADPERAVLVEHLSSVLETVGADRAAIVQVDDYSFIVGPRVAPFCIVDLAHERPRRRFSLEPLREAADAGVPGFVDYPDMERAGRQILVEAPRSLAAVCLGSDGVRTWYFVVDSRTPRGRLGEDALARLMFAAGECSAIVLHRDMSNPGGLAGDPDPDDPDFDRDLRGFPILRDLEGREDDEVLRDRLGFRFLIGRHLLNRARDGFDLESESARESAGHCLDEIRGGRFDDSDTEYRGWTDVLEGVQEGDHDRVARGAVGIAAVAEESDHLHGALVLLGVASELTALIADVPRAIEVARRQGRVWRRLGYWESSERSYGAALELAELTENRPAQAFVLDGLANNRREQGDFGGARELLARMRELVDGLEDRVLRGRARQSMMALEISAGRPFHAAHHGWSAVEIFDESDPGYFQSLFDLAGVFVRVGDFDAAADAFESVRDRCGNSTVEAAARAALVTLAAQRGDLELFEARAATFDESTDLSLLPPHVAAQITLERGEVLAELGLHARARPWLDRTRELSAQHGFAELIQRVEVAAGGEAGPASRGTVPTPDPEERAYLLEARGGVRSLRLA